MNIFLLILIIISSVFINAKESFELKIKKITFDYARAAELIENQTLTTDIENNNVFISNFFNETGLYSKRAIKKFTQSLNSIKKLATKKNIPQEQIIFVNTSILRLEKIQQFIAKHANTYYAEKIYNEIEEIYHCIDEQDENILDQPKLLDISTQKNRSLYHFVKKINLDIRRLHALLALENIADKTIIKLNNLLTKTSILQERFVETSIYKQQLRRTRWLKACGIVFVPMIFIFPIVALYAIIAPITMMATVPALIFGAPVLGLVYASLIVSIVTTVQDIKEAREFEIPVEARSIFSLVSWQGWIIQIGISVPLIISAII